VLGGIIARKSWKYPLKKTLLRDWIWRQLLHSLLSAAQQGMLAKHRENWVRCCSTSYVFNWLKCRWYGLAENTRRDFRERSRRTIRNSLNSLSMRKPSHDKAGRIPRNSTSWGRYARMRSRRARLTGTGVACLTQTSFWQAVDQWRARDWPLFQQTQSNLEHRTSALFSHLKRSWAFRSLCNQFSNEKDHIQRPGKASCTRISSSLKCNFLELHLLCVWVVEQRLPNRE
jgi:hypothetical protein